MTEVLIPCLSPAIPPHYIINHRRMRSQLCSARGQFMVPPPPPPVHKSTAGDIILRLLWRRELLTLLIGEEGEVEERSMHLLIHWCGKLRSAAQPVLVHVCVCVCKTSMQLQVIKLKWNAHTHTHTHTHTRPCTHTLGNPGRDPLCIPRLRLWPFVLSVKAVCLKLCSKTAYLTQPQSDPDESPGISCTPSPPASASAQRIHTELGVFPPGYRRRQVEGARGV